jgi:geranylgeranylglycerol-phosphate geranylgeranyltransferase
MSKLGGFIRLMRPVNCVMMGFAVLVGAVLASSQFTGLNWLSVLFGFLTGFTFCAAAMVINDYHDRGIDAINEPSRPIPSGLVKTREALAFMAVLVAVGFFFAFYVSVLCFAVAAAALVITATYVTVGKRTGLPGNFLVSVCVAIPFLYGSIVVAPPHAPAYAFIKLNVVLFASMAFLSNTGREITKGIVDVKGDSTEGVKTLAVRYGEKTAAVAATGFYVTAVALTPVTWFLGLVSIWFVPFVLVTDCGLVGCSVLLLRDYSRENSKRIKNLVLLWFVFGLLAYIFGIFK